MATRRAQLGITARAVSRWPTEGFTDLMWERRGKSLAVFVCEFRPWPLASTCVNEDRAASAGTPPPDPTGVRAMLERPTEFWETIPTLVASKVRPVLYRSPKAREAVIEYLRDLEAVARLESPSRNAVQAIASGRRLLGDEAEIGRGIRRSFQTLLDSRA